MIKDKQTNQKSVKSEQRGLDRDGLHQGLQNRLRIKILSLKTHTKAKTKPRKE